MVNKPSGSLLADGTVTLIFVVVPTGLTDYFGNRACQCNRKTFGKITNEEIGDTSFGYDAIFMSDDVGVTFGEASSDDKNMVSHRYRALIQIKDII